MTARHSSGSASSGRRRAAARVVADGLAAMPMRVHRLRRRPPLIVQRLRRKGVGVTVERLLPWAFARPLCVPWQLG